MKFEKSFLALSNNPLWKKVLKNGESEMVKNFEKLTTEEKVFFEEVYRTVLKNLESKMLKL